MSAANILNNTILIPTSGGSDQLEAYDIAAKVQTVNGLSMSGTSFSYDLYIKMSDSQSENIIYLQEVTGFGMTRENETKAGVNPEYVINLPGPITYSDITLKHLFTNDKFFLNWLKNGVTAGGASRVDMELHFKLPTGKEIIFTLEDAFPVSWMIGPLDEKGEDTLYEIVKITYSAMVYKSGDR